MQPKESTPADAGMIGPRMLPKRPPRRGLRALRARFVLTAAQARALQAMATAPDESLRGISWMTVRALRALGLCELGPGRHGRITREGRTALCELALTEATTAPATAPTPDCKGP